MNNNHTTPSYLCCLLLLLLLAACASRSTVGEQLRRADSLLDSHPDSALRLLESIAPDSLPTEADSAYYALLLTQARDKNYIPQTDDSLIRSAARYYDRRKDAPMQARTYYLWGGVYCNRNQQGTALKHFYTALSYAKTMEDQRLTGIIYHNMAYLYQLQSMYAKADSIYLLCEQIGVQRKDTLFWAENFYFHGLIMSYQKMYPAAEEKAKAALALLGDRDQGSLRANIFSLLSDICNITGRAEEAIRYAWRNFGLQRGRVCLSEIYPLLGEAYFKAHQYDSAAYYYEKSLSSDRYVIKSNAYMRLARIAKNEGKPLLASEMERLHSLYQDCLNQAAQGQALVETEKQVALEEQQRSHQSTLSVYRYYLFGILLISLLLAAGLWRHHKTQLWRQRHTYQEEEKGLLQQCMQQKQQIDAKEEQIGRLQEEIDRQKMTEQEKQCLEREVATLHRERAALVQKALEQSDVYAKIKRILDDCKEKDHSKESLCEADWLSLSARLDKAEVIARLGIQYGLTDKDVHYCYLLLLNLTAVERSFLMQVSRRTSYRFEKEILEKMGEMYVAGKLQQLLKNRVKV